MVREACAWERGCRFGLPRGKIPVGRCKTTHFVSTLTDSPPIPLTSSRPPPPSLVARAGIYPLQNTCIRKVKVLKAPKFDITKLMEVHGDYSEEVGAKIERPVVTEVVGAAE